MQSLPAMHHSAPGRPAGQSVARSGHLQVCSTHPGKVCSRQHSRYRLTCVTHCSGSQEEPTTHKHGRRALLLAAGAAGVTVAAPLPGQAPAAAPAAESNAVALPALQALQPTSPAATAASPSGIAAYRDPTVFRGLATSQSVRQAQRLQGLVPRRAVPLEQEIQRAAGAVARCCSPLEKFQALATLRECSQAVFYGLISRDIPRYLPLIYTPVVGEACQQWSRLLQRPTGLYLSIKDAGRVAELVRSWPEERVRIAVLTDGERILGLGDLGANGQGIPTGKAAVYAAGGGRPQHVLPITLDTGCDVQSVREDPLYIGEPQGRVRGEQYDAFVDEVISALLSRYGDSLVVHWEDFAGSNSYRLLDKYRKQGVCTFNDDIESTAAVVVGALYGASRAPGVPRLSEQRFMFVGAGQASIGPARLVAQALRADGLDAGAARQRIWLFDSKGLVHRGRQDLSPEKHEFARAADEAEGLPAGLEAAVRELQPSALLGAAAKQGLFSQGVLEALVQATQQRYGREARPVVMALSNPASVAECTARQVHDWTAGQAVFASGTAFDAFEVNGQRYQAAQANNCLAFPGVGLGCIASGATEVTSDMMLAAARALGGLASRQELQQGMVLPDISRLREASLEVAAAVACAASISMVASQDGTSRLACLPSNGSNPMPDRGQLAKVKTCIAPLQYDPFTE